MENISLSVGFIGAGNMGMALIKGFMKRAGDNCDAMAYDIDAGKKELLEALGLRFMSGSAELVKAAKYVFLICKPQQLGQLLEEIKPYIKKESVLVSLCAGISDEFIINRTYPWVKTVLVMPNTPMTLGLGASALAGGANASEAETEAVKGILDCAGISEIIPAEKMKEIIAVNGSSPAFIYRFADGFSRYAAENGIDGEKALRLFAQTLIGAGTMLMNSGLSPKALEAQVTSKGGTTEAGLLEFERGDLPALVKKACEACTKRAYELGETS